MSYTLTWIIGVPNRAKECRIYLRYYSKGSDVRFKSNVKIEKKYFKGGKDPISKHPNSELFNTELNNMRLELERVLSGFKGVVRPDLLERDILPETADIYLTDYIKKFKELNKGYSEGRLKHYQVLYNNIEEYNSKAMLPEIDSEWLKKYENWLRDRKDQHQNQISTNTLISKMKLLKAVLNNAIKEGVIADKIKAYKYPKSEESIPAYLTEKEIMSFKKIVDSTENKKIKTSGYYFLLSCFAGYRISDLFSFNYDDRVIGNAIVLRANKNKKIVSIPIYPQLGEIIEYCKSNKIQVSEQEMRKHVKGISKMAGIVGRDIKVHSGRHSFAMLMLEKGLSIDEVAELLGDTVSVAKKYARITNKHLHGKILSAFN